jgi:AraC-like DNA-binding protein
MSSSDSGDIEISVPYFEIEQTISSPRYHWGCQDRGDEPFVIVQWTLSGRGIYEDSKGPVPVPAGHAFLAVVPEHSTYYYPPDGREPWVFTWINLYGSLGCDLARKFHAKFGPVIPLSARGATAAALRRLLTLTAQADSLNRSRISLQAYAFLLEWWREASLPAHGPEHGLARAISFCHEHFREPLGVKQIAQEAGMSREHFSRIFREHTGQSPGNFLRGLRVNEAGMLLRETNLPLGEISMRSGFYSSQHLMRTFQRLHGISPTEYRRTKGKASS